MRLENKIAVITGSASGMGRAMADRFTREGALVVVVDINDKAIGPAVDEIKAAGGRAVGHAVDVTKRDQVHAFVNRVAQDHGRIDVLVNNAGVTRYRPFATATDEDWNAVLDVDVKGVFYCAQAVAPHMVRQGYGKIVNIASVAGMGSTPHHTAGSPGGSAAYASSKAAIVQMTKTLAHELGPHGINVNCIAPGSFLTAMTRSTRTPEEVEEHTRFRSSVAVLKRLGRIEELAAAVLFLASDDASFIAGQTICVDGGRTDKM